MTARAFDVPCTLDIACTAESFHAHVELDGVGEIHPGDRVAVHDAPTGIEFGQQMVVRRTATVTRASWIERLWVRVVAYCGLTELYEIGFSIGRQR